MDPLPTELSNETEWTESADVVPNSTPPGRARAGSETTPECEKKGDGGIALGVLAVFAFSLTLPATRVAASALGGAFVGMGRATVAAVLAGITLRHRREPFPDRRHWPGLAMVAIGCVIGFSLFASIGLQFVPAAHGAVLIGLMPAATATFAILRSGEKPPHGFVMACGAGIAATLIFAVTEGAGMPKPGDLLLLFAAVVGGMGYAEGGRLAKEIGGWRVICWALIFGGPFAALPLAGFLAMHRVAGPPIAWVCFGYLCCVSMFLSFFAWYAAMARGGVARISQLQLAQPVLSLVWASLFLGEPIRPATVLAAAVLIGVAAWVQRLGRIPVAPTR